MADEEREEADFDIEDIMVEIKVAAPELSEFLAYVAGAVEEGAATEQELHSVLELVYSFSKWKNDDEETRMIEGRN